MEIDSKSGQDRRAQIVALRAERDAQERISRAADQVREAEKDSRARIDQIEDEFVRDSQVRSERHEAYVAALKAKQLEESRRVSLEHNRELSRLTRDGSDQALKTADHYNHALYTTEQDGAAKLRDVQVKHQLLLDHEQTQSNRTIEQMREDNAKRVEQEREQTRLKYEGLQAENQGQLEEFQQNSQVARTQAYDKYQGDYQKNLATYQSSLKRLNATANQQLQTTQLDTSRKLAAYTDRASDPFYQMLDLGARVEESEHGFEIRAHVPEHEQAGVAVSVRGTQLVLSGKRRNQEKVDVEPGRSRQTASFQSYSETLDLGQPLEAARLSKEFDGDTLIVRVPKKPSYSEYQAYQAKRQVERAVQERPRFPDNLPISTQSKKGGSGEPGGSSTPLT